MIACTLNFGIPVIIGDLLLSDKVKPDYFILPSFSENILDYLDESDRFPVQLSRKIYVITDKVCVGLAGKVVRFKPFLEDLSIFCRAHKNLQPEQLNAFLTEYVNNDPYRDDVHALIYLFYEAGGEQLIGRFVKGSGIEGNVPGFEYLIALGSGAIDFRKEIIEAGTLISRLKPGSLAYAVQLNAILISKILTKERAILHTFKEFWGAGFEMIYIKGGQFTLLDDICYIVNYANESSGGIDFPAPVTAMRYKYYGDVLVITVIQALRGQTEVTDSQVIVTYLDYTVKQFPVLPVNYVDKFNIEAEVKDASFTCYQNGMGYIIETSEGKYMPASFNIGKELSVVYEQGKTLVITMDRQINDTLINESKKNLE